MNNTLLFDTLQPQDILQQELSAARRFLFQHHTLLYVRSGSGKLCLDSYDFGIPENTLLLLPPTVCEIHPLPDVPLQLVTMAFSTPCTSFEKLSPLLSMQPVPLSAGLRPHLLSILSGSTQQDPFAADHVALELQYLLLFLADILAPFESPSSTAHREEAALSQILSYIQDHLSEEISFQDLVDCSSCSSKQVYALFRKHFQTTPMKYLSEFRIETAKKLLLISQMSITQIATVCGFQTVHYFSHVFKLSTGLSPNAFRQQSLPPSP